MADDLSGDETRPAWADLVDRIRLHFANPNEDDLMRGYSHEDWELAHEAADALEAGAAAVAQVAQLEAWKESAIAVMAEWDKVYDALGRPGQWGGSMAAAALAEVQRLVAAPSTPAPERCPTCNRRRPPLDRNDGSLGSFCTDPWHITEEPS